MRHSEIELFLNDLSDEDESCSEFEDNVEEADSSKSSSGESETALVPVEIITSKNGQLTYSKKLFGNSHGRASRENIINLMPGLTRYASYRITQVEISSFELFFPSPLVRIILNYTKIEGRRIYEKEWTDIDSTHLHSLDYYCWLVYFDQIMKKIKQ